MPGPVKYSALARKVTRRLRESGMWIQSAADRWLDARIAAPVVGHVLRALGARTEDGVDRRADRDELEEPVEQHASLVNCQTREPDRRITIGCTE